MLVDLAETQRRAAARSGICGNRPFFAVNVALRAAGQPAITRQGPDV